MREDKPRRRILSPTLLYATLKESGAQIILKNIPLVSIFSLSLENPLGECIEHRHLLKFVYQIVEKGSIMINHSKV